MCQTDAVGRVDVERLRLGGFRATGRRVANVTDTHVARQAQHVARVEHVTDEAVGPALLQSLLAPGDDASRILTAVLHHRQAIVERLVDGVPANDSDNAAHASLRIQFPPGSLSCFGSSTGSASAGASGVSSS